MADDLRRRVIIVDTSNEISAMVTSLTPRWGRRGGCKVHQVMIQAVEKHMPEVIVIDEIGREMEAAAARTIAERGTCCARGVQPRLHTRCVNSSNTRRLIRIAETCRARSCPTGRRWPPTRAIGGNRCRLSGSCSGGSLHRGD